MANSDPDGDRVSRERHAGLLAERVCTVQEKVLPAGVPHFACLDDDPSLAYFRGR